MQVRQVIAAAVVAGPLLAGGMLAAAPAGAADEAAEVVEKVHAALGGAALEQVAALRLKGSFRREMGPRQMAGALVLTLARPDRLHRSEEMEMPGGASVERVSALAGDASWDDTQNRGGMGGGMVMMFRGPDGEPPNPEAMAAMRTRRLKAELSRWLLALFAESDQPLTYAGLAQAPDGTAADVLERKDERGQAMRLFVDRQSGMPLMLTYQEVRPRMMTGPGPGQGGPGARGRRGAAEDPEAMKARMAEARRRMEAEGPPPPTTVTLFLADYREVNGVKLPHRLTESVDGKPAMEWTVEKIDVNPKLKADFFTKK